MKRIEYPNIIGDKDIAKAMQEAAKRIAEEASKQEEALFREALKCFAEPPIKGKITAGKLKWRGIKIVRINKGFERYSWLEQRGERISPTFVVGSNSIFTGLND